MSDILVIYLTLKPPPRSAYSGCLMRFTSASFPDALPETSVLGGTPLLLVIGRDTGCWVLDAGCWILMRRRACPPETCLAGEGGVGIAIGIGIGIGLIDYDPPAEDEYD